MIFSSDFLMSALEQVCMYNINTLSLALSSIYNFRNSTVECG